ncbi:RNA polymerase II subunit 5-mediating protein homolog isoform X2 [Ricinus communis]|uniref:RNA polymerase II subunit 5-mediating protein homolog isoform X2 n=1 Tax=Ricinus communis TaxID=3988 RepID=UPI00201AE6C3|nr:RNA polymerase II subunit 5-mediating protein homolog isoform X2 [Ricinus communis]
MEESRKGTVTSFASIFPVNEAHKAAKRVEEAISEKQNELVSLNQFIADNNNLINLITRLPDQLHHDVMVPFGKAAFFPGKLIHTNELVVLLGEGYYAERTAKQTAEILKRRGKVLDSQVESLKANIKDLRAEASFFDSTASETAEGLVEIREDYVEESSSEVQSKVGTDDKKVGVEDDEYARMMSRFDELEKEELEAEGDTEIDEDDHANTAESDNESDTNEDSDMVESDNGSDKDEQTYRPERGSDNVENHHFSSETHSEIRKPQKQPIVETATIETLSNNYLRQLDIADQPNCTGLTVQPVPKDVTSNIKSLTHSKNSILAEKALQLPSAKEEIETVSSSRNEVPLQNSKSRFDSSNAFTGSIVERSGNLKTSSQDQTATSSQTAVRTSKSGFDSSKAFTGSIVERACTVSSSHEQTKTSSQPPNPQPSKPVSRFKLQRK